MHPYIKPLAKELKDIADPERAVGAKAYMKTQFEFFGMPMDERRAVCRHHMKTHLVHDEKELETIVKELWMLPEREFQYCGIELMAYHKKLWTSSIIKLFEYCITTKSWWDTVDFISSECNAKYFKLFPKQIVPITSKWNHSNNIWLQRCSLLFQKSYKKDLNTLLLSEYILNVSSSKEFFIQKAIGWVLREFARTDPEWVKEFIGSHDLPSLSKREAMKHLG